MSIKQRIRALEIQHTLAMGKEPWLTFEFEEEPTPQQRLEMDEADRQGRTYICFIAKGQTVYLSLLGNPPWLD